MSSSSKSSGTTERAPTHTQTRRRRVCPGAAVWRHQARARAVLIVAVNGEKVLGPRFIRLLEEIRTQGSVRRAALSLGIGYRHAIDWIRRAEALVERPLVIRRAGGVAGGGSGLTPEGVMLVRKYRRISRALGKIAAHAEEEILGRPK